LNINREYQRNQAGWLVTQRVIDSLKLLFLEREQYMKKLFLCVFAVTLLCTWAVVLADTTSKTPKASDSKPSETVQNAVTIDVEKNAAELARKREAQGGVKLAPDAVGLPGVLPLTEKKHSVRLLEPLQDPDYSLTAPIVDHEGNTCGARDDCDLRGSEDIIYEIEIPSADTWEFTLCSPDPEAWDSFIYLGSITCSDDISEDDDGCLAMGGQSVIVQELEAGTYYLTIEGWAVSGCGAYTLNVDIWVPPPAACCVDQVCIGDTQEAECIDQGGVWLWDQTCDDPEVMCPEGCLVQFPNYASGVFSDIDCNQCTNGTQVLAEPFYVGSANTINSVAFWGGYSGEVMETDCFDVVFRYNDGVYPGVEIDRVSCVPGVRIEGDPGYMYTIDVSSLNLNLSPGLYYCEIYNNSEALGAESDWYWYTGDLDEYTGMQGMSWTPYWPEDWFFDNGQNNCLVMDCGTPSLGACCDYMTWDCTEGVTPLECIAGGGTWLRDATCEDFDPPCEPAYCDPCYSNTTDEWISNVTFNTINNTTGPEGAPCSYGDYLAMSTEVGMHQTYQLSVEVSQASGPFVEQVWAFIDWNQNYSFYDDGEAYDIGEGETSQFTVTADIDIPGYALPGDTRMRVVVHWSTDPGPCDQLTYGEVEDYTLNAIPGPRACCVDGDCIGDLAEIDCEGTWHPNAQCDGILPAPICAQDLCGYDNGAPLDDVGSPGTQLDPFREPPFSAESADDFVLEGEGQCEMIYLRVWAAHYNDDGQGTTDNWAGVDVTIYANNPDGDGPDGDRNDDGSFNEYHDGGLVYNQTYAPGEYTTTELAPTCTDDLFQVDITLTGLALDRGTKYWLVVQPILDFQSYGQVAHVLSQASNGNAAQQIFRLAGNPVWAEISGNGNACDPDTPPASTRRDLAFLLAEELGGNCGDYVVGDYNCSGLPNVADVVDMYAKLKTGSPVYPDCECDCLGDGDIWPVGGDVNSSCAMNVADVVDLYSKLKTGSPELTPCMDCPPDSWLNPGGGDRPLVVPNLESKARLKTGSGMD
jgi:hypothetical protein